MPNIPLIFQAPEDRPLVKVVYAVIPQPAAGQNLVLTVPQGYRMQIQTLHVDFTTDANVIDRNLFAQVDTAVGVIYYFQHPFAISNGETRSVCVAPGLSLIAHSATVLSAIWPFPLNLVLEEGTILTIGLTNIQVGDQFAPAEYMALSQFVAE